MASATLRDYLQYTEDAISAGRIDEAQARCQRILSHFPESLEAQRLLGEVYLAQEQLEEAQQTFDWILVNDPENIVVYCDRALICERLSDYDTALDCYQQAYELSRGDSQIRHEFNKLSARVGQQGFMLSRAGLARLYMRGDLLPQAIQEWEAVLAATPDRLDARVGLLETCWHEGLFEQVEELATAILSDVPGCLKALLLLAHVISSKDMQRAEELIRRAEMLDPDLIMARELFSDLLANQPRDPFLQLLKQEPVTLPDPLSPASTSMETAQSTPAITNGSQDTPPSPAESLFSWSSLDTLIVETGQPVQAEQDIPTFAWSSNSALDINPWSAIDQLAGQPTASVPASEAKPTSQGEPSPPQEPGTSGQQKDQLTAPAADTFAMWNSTSTESESSATASTWATEADEETALPTPPAWLDMLTRGGRSQSTPPPSASSISPASPASAGRGGSPDTATSGSESRSTSAGTGPLFPEPAPSSQAPWDDGLQMAPVTADDDDEAFSFGPDWLKSLGAEVLENNTASTPAPVEPTIVAEEQHPADPAPYSEFEFWQESSWSSKTGETGQQGTPTHSWLEQPGSTEASWQTPIDPWAETASAGRPEPESEKPEVERQLATLETLERDLFAQGFVPLEPGSLATIAGEEELSSALAPFGSETESQTQPTPVYEEQPSSQPQQMAVPQAQPAQAQPPAPVAPPALPATEGTEEPLWLATPAPSASASNGGSAIQELLAQAAPQSRQSPEQTADALQPAPSAARATPAPDVQAGQPVPTVPKKPTPASEITLDELELTMRRPVVKLQPAAQKPTAPTGSTQPAAGSRSRPAASAANVVGENNLSYKERLRKGYHHQLAGDYDEAMQEYRVIIRNAPELLSEVVSNMRALLKLAPRYAPGYRVLGDAYMRQGEYLQAMEAYNKALMMAKKGQAQGQVQGLR